MRYLIIIESDEKVFKTASPKKMEEMNSAYIAYSAELRKAGVMLAGDPLYPSAQHGARIQVRDGKRTVTDGPFTEAKELVGGYYLIQVKSHEEAVEWAARCPGAIYGTIELREIRDFP